MVVKEEAVGAQAAAASAHEKVCPLPPLVVGVASMKAWMAPLVLTAQATAHELQVCCQRPTLWMAVLFLTALATAHEPQVCCQMPALVVTVALFLAVLVSS